ncbi:hypothetical protein SOP85_25525 [Pseudomonas sp. YuFO20]|uniref:hypothetical protein n=1 Tax=Pseudomonas sp. YuFO20 TaxID=3095362 RepID=UPI002B24FE1C|nr:hypothetical protein [Pseudomonas sp. YuFO20]MEB2518759.1 hypothetical protein [Pseudomonas sp. YuFO20]
MSNYSADQIIACRRVAMEQNRKLFEEANAINRSALDLLDRSDFDSEMFLVYLQLQEKAKHLFREALEHITLLEEQFPSPQLQNTIDGSARKSALLNEARREESSATLAVFQST